MKAARVFVIMMLLAGCQNGETLLLQHPLVRALVEKVTGQENTI